MSRYTIINITIVTKIYDIGIGIDSFIGDNSNGVIISISSSNSSTH